MMSQSTFDVVWALGFTFILGIFCVNKAIASLKTDDKPKVSEKPVIPAISDFSRGRVVQVLNGEVFTRLTHLVDKKKGLFNFAELLTVDKFGQPVGVPVLREGDFDDLINEVAGIPEGSLAFCSTPEYPDTLKKSLEKAQASRRMKRLPPPSIKALPAPTQLQ